jgi:hypothetical protein
MEERWDVCVVALKGQFVELILQTRLKLFQSIGDLVLLTDPNL